MRLLSMAEGLLAASEKADVGGRRCRRPPEEVRTGQIISATETPTEVKGEASQ